MLPIHMLVVTCALAASPGPQVETGAAPPASPSAPGQRLPPDGERAAAALLASPRHGEWVDVTMPRAGEGDEAQERIKTWVVYPERSDAAPVVLVIHEIFGLTDWVRGVADALAAEGFIAVAPDLLSGKGPGGGATDSFEGDKVREAVRSLTPKEVAERLNAVRSWALARPAAGKASACIGFCWGGSMSFEYAAAQPGLDGAIVYYGTASSDRDELARIACPVIGFYGVDDARVTSTVPGTEKLMRELGKSFTAKTYEGAGHGFLRQQTGRDGANLAAARDSWARTIAFLKERTEGGATPKAPAPQAPSTP